MRSEGLEAPPTRYATSGGHRIAYQVVGEGPIDLLYMPSVGDCIDVRWDWQPYATFLRRLSSFCRLIQFDRRGVGASDPVSLEALPTWELWIDDARVVLDTVGSEQVAVLGTNDAGPSAIMFAATQPQRTAAVILANTCARFDAGVGLDSGDEADARARSIDAVAALWGTETLAEITCPDAARDPAFAPWLAKLQRLACSPREASAYMYWLNQTDARDALSSIRAPTLVLHREHTRAITIEQGRHLAESIPGARFVPLPGADMAVHSEPYGEALTEIEEFLTGVRPRAEPDRALAAVVFTDIVDSTARAASLGDRRWRSLLETHDAMAASMVERHRGRLVKTTGDGVLATFEGPGKAIRFAVALRDALHPLGIDIRAGTHTGEVEMRGDDIGGIAVHIAARLLNHAHAGEVVVTATVPMLVAGSGLEFTDRGEHELKGVPGVWQLFVVQD